MIFSQVLSPSQRALFPSSPVKFLGYTIYKAARYTGQNGWNLATGHYNYARQIPQTINRSMKSDIRAKLPDDVLSKPIGGTAVMHSHQTMAAMSQKYKLPIWQVPDANLEEEDKNTVRGNSARYRATQSGYTEFAADLLSRMRGI